LVVMDEAVEEHRTLLLRHHGLLPVRTDEGPDRLDAVPERDHHELVPGVPLWTPGVETEEPLLIAHQRDREPARHGLEVGLPARLDVGAKDTDDHRNLRNAIDLSTGSTPLPVPGRSRPKGLETDAPRARHAIGVAPSSPVTARSASAPRSMPPRTPGASPPPA